MHHKLPTIRQRLLSGAIWAFIGRIIMACGGLVVSILITRLLPQEDVGRYFLVFSMVAVVAIIGQMGMQILIVKIASAALVKKSTAELRKLILSIQPNRCSDLWNRWISTWLYR